MSLSNITLTAAVRQNLLSLQGTADLLATTQGRLATGKKVNSALDNPTNFFTAAGLDSRASDISNLLDSIGNGVQVLQAANTGITSLSKLVDTAKSIANQVLQQPSGYSARSTVTSAAALGGTAANLVDGVTIKSGQTIIVAANGSLPAVTVTIGAIATLFVLPDRPNDVRWLRPEERNWLTSRLAEERQAKAHVEHMTIWQALRHPAVLLLTAGLFFTYTGGYAIWFWMPTILQRYTGWTVQHISWIGSIPFVAGFVGMLLLGWSSDRFRERRWHFAIPQLTAAAALGMWFFLPHSNTLLVVILSLVIFGTIAYLPSFWALPSEILTSSAAAAAVGFINCTASIGGFFGPKMIGNLSQQTGSFNAGYIFMIVCWMIASVLVLLCPRERR